METQMTTQLQMLKEKLFGTDGLRASNFKMYRGNSQDASVEEVAAELNTALERLKNGESTVVADIG